MDRGKHLTWAARIGGHSGMRAALFRLSALWAGSLLVLGCTTCPSSNRASVPDTAPLPARFIVSASLSGNAELSLLDSDLAAISFDASGTSTQAWIVTQSRWSNMRGAGIGADPLLPRALSSGVPGLVTIAGATSLIALGLPTAQTDWEWLEPRTDENTLPPILDVLVVPDVTAEMHDYAFVLRDRIPHGSTPFGGALTAGGDILVLDVEDRAQPPVLLGAVSLDGVADSGLDVSPRSLTLAGSYVYAALAHGLMLGPAGSPITRVGDGLVVAIDPLARTVRTVVRIPGRTHCEQVVSVVSDPPDGRVIVACAGTPATPAEIPDDAALAIIARDPDPTHAATPVVTRTFPAGVLMIPSPDHGLLALSGAYVAFVAKGSAADPILADRFFVVNLDTERAEIIGTTPADSTTAPGGFGTGAFDPVTARLVMPAGREGLRSWTLAPADPVTGVIPSFGEDAASTSLSTCTGLPLRAVRLIPAAPPPAP